MALSSIRVQLEFEERDEAGRVKERTLSQPLVVYAAGIPDNLLDWLKVIAKQFNLGEV